MNKKTKFILFGTGGLLFLFIIIFGVFVTRYNPTATSMLNVTETDLGDGWKRIRNEIYHYQMDVPDEYSISKNSTVQNIELRHKEGEHGSYLGYVSISLLGLYHESVDVAASRAMFPSENLEHKTINGNQAIRFQRKPSNDNPTVEGKIVLKSAEDLIFLIETDSRNNEERGAMLERSIETFQFFVHPQKNVQALTISGKIFRMSGNGMPGSMSIQTTPYKKPFHAYSSEPSHIGDKTKTRVATVTPDREGNYSINLPQGTYSFYTDESSSNSSQICSNEFRQHWSFECPVTLYGRDLALDLTIVDVAF